MEPEKHPGKYSGVGKVAAVSAAILLVSLGLCGLSVAHMQNESYQSLGMVGLVGIGLGVLGLLGSGLAAVIIYFSKG